MAQYIAVRALHRSALIPVVNSDGDRVKLSTESDTVLDLDRADNRRALAHHSAIGQYVVSAANASTGATALDANTNP